MAESTRCDCQVCPARLLSVFHALPAAQLAAFNQSKISRRYKKGQMLFAEGERPAGVFCVFDGRVKLYHSGGDGREQIVRVAGRGDVLGFSSLFAEETYSNSAQAIEDATVCYIDKSAFFPLLSRHPDLAIEVMRKLSRDLLSVQSQAADLGMKPADQRLAGLLLMLKETFGQGRKDGVGLNLPLTRKELAEMIGTTTETLVRLLSRFQEEGYVKIESKEIVLTDLPALSEMALNSLG